jgi:hypothetical protein
MFIQYQTRKLFIIKNDKGKSYSSPCLCHEEAEVYLLALLTLIRQK